uniref:Astacin domain-containing protein n=1 Tax=Angiostrongylus cantonensis TaxID=6313 RepID=A0A0K0DN73_ANGCA
LGFFHMQSRCDHDDFIKLQWENFKADWAPQFSQQTNHTNYNYNLTYDYGDYEGVMHYGATGKVPEWGILSSEELF